MRPVVGRRLSAFHSANIRLFFQIPFIIFLFCEANDVCYYALVKSAGLGNEFKGVRLIQKNGVNNQRGGAVRCAIGYPPHVKN